MTLDQQLLDTWAIHNRINLYLLDSIDESYLDSVASSKGRSVAEQFAHLYNVRLMWLKAASPDLLEGLEKLEKENLTREILAQSLNASSKAVEALLEKGFAENKIKGFKPHPAAFFGYLISHESHHRGQIMLALKQSGHSVDKKVQFGMWEWGSR